MSQSCGCNTAERQSCTPEVLNRLAGQYTCGARINYLINSENYSELDACRKIGGEEFPCDCGPCNPDTCTSDIVRTVAPTLPPVNPPASLYCFPDENNRVTYLDMWDGSYKVQVKEGNVCGPGNNRFTKDTVSVTKGTPTGTGGTDSDSLVLHLKKNVNTGVWESSEVRIVNPDESPFQYGNYTFHVESVAVKNGSGQTTSTILPANIVLGLFTWDPTDRYSSHENWNHEVDVEVSRWGTDTNADTQFLIQPPGSPQMYRFYSGPTGSPDTYEQSDQWHSIRWLPNRMLWSSTAGGGQSHVYTTENAVLSGCEDLVQCLPADVEIRINLWNMDGPLAPRGLLNDDDYVEVVIGNFVYEEAGIDFVAPGDYCSKHCQCEAAQGCVDGKCIAVTTAPMTSTPAPVKATLAPMASTPAPVASTSAPVASTPAPVPSTLAPVGSPTSNCEIKIQVENIETKVETLETMIQNVQSEIATIESTTARILSVLQTVSSTPAPVASTPAPVPCTDRNGQWKIGTKTKNWCNWAGMLGASKIPNRCRAKKLNGDCPKTCGSCA